MTDITMRPSSLPDCSVCHACNSNSRLPLTTRTSATRRLRTGRFRQQLSSGMPGAELHIVVRQRYPRKRQVGVRAAPSRWVGINVVWQQGQPQDAESSGMPAAAQGAGRTLQPHIQFRRPAVRLFATADAPPACKRRCVALAPVLAALAAAHARGCSHLGRPPPAWSRALS